MRHLHRHRWLAARLLELRVAAYWITAAITFVVLRSHMSSPWIAAAFLLALAGLSIGFAGTWVKAVPWIGSGLIALAYGALLAVGLFWALQCWDCAERFYLGDMYVKRYEFVGWTALIVGIPAWSVLVSIWAGVGTTVLLRRIMEARPRMEPASPNGS